MENENEAITKKINQKAINKRAEDKRKTDPKRIEYCKLLRQQPDMKKRSAIGTWKRRGVYQTTMTSNMINTYLRYTANYSLYCLKAMGCRRNVLTIIMTMEHFVTFYVISVTGLN